MKNLFLLFITFLPARCFSQDMLQRIPITLEKLRIDISVDSSREIGYTNKQAGVYYTETNGDHRSAWQGGRIMSTEMMDDYFVTIDDKPLRRSESRAMVYPHQLDREYRNGVHE